MIPKALGLLVALGAWASAAPAQDVAVRLNEIQVLGTHDSHSQGVDPQILAMVEDRIGARLAATIGRDRMATPDDVRGGCPTLGAAVLAGDWPTLEASRGRFAFLLSTAAETDAVAGDLEGRPSLEGRAAFLLSSPGQAHAAFAVVDNAVLRQEIGHLVRTRADIETHEAKARDMSRAEAAFAGGAQVDWRTVFPQTLSRPASSPAAPLQWTFTRCSRRPPKRGRRMP